MLKSPWVGGHNFCQLSDIDINQDGIKDIFLFDRTGNRITAYINKGTPNTVDYKDSTLKYASHFPMMEDWAILTDYNCDGKEDIFTYAITVGGIKVWKNTSTGNNLQFTLAYNYLLSDYTPSVTTDPNSNLFISRVDVPAVEDLDNDGDLDILVFDFSSTYVEHHINQAKEKGYPCDSLVFILDPAGCWGNFQENASNCSVTLGACRKMAPGTTLPSSVQSGMPGNLNDGERHAGSCTLCLDMDGDGDKEVLIGDISCCNMTLLTNGGTPASANMTAKDTSFPSTDVPIALTIFPCGYFLDVNNDNKRDLIVSPNAANVSVNTSSIWFYQNMGADNAPVFDRKKRNLFQEDMIEVGEGADPVFFDYNQDGLTDLLVSNYHAQKDTCPKSNSYGVRAYRNIGTPGAPSFDLDQTDFASLSTHLPNITAKHLTFGDLDNDGDPDMMVGDFDGKLHYFTNTAGAGNPCNFSFTNPNYADVNNIPIDIGSYATPQFADLDRDGDLDLLIGERAGNINLYSNIGTSSAPSYTLTTQNLGGVDTYKPCCTGYSVPFLFDSAGSYRLIVGSEASRINGLSTGWIWYYKNIDGNLGGNFTLADSMYMNIWEGLRMAVHGKDINNDGRMDLAIGNYSGGLAIYLGDTSLVPVEELSAPPIHFSIYPNPSQGELTIQADLGGPFEPIELIIQNTMGEVVYRSMMNQLHQKFDPNLANGIYICTLKTATRTANQKLILIH